MTAEPNSSRWRSSDELLVLHAVRLAGFADTEAIVARFELSAGSVGDTLRVLEGESLIERMAFADSSGWILTDAGKSRDAEMLREELDASGARPVLHATVENFERSMNPLLVRVITEWQLHPSTNRPDSRVEVLQELTDLAKGLSDLMAELVARLARFGRYPRQFSTAVANARAGDDRWVAGVGRLSCHIVWAELHEDLLSSLGHDRSAEPRLGGR